MEDTLHELFNKLTEEELQLTICFIRKGYPVRDSVCMALNELWGKEVVPAYTVQYVDANGYLTSPSQPNCIDNGQYLADQFEVWKGC